MSGDSISLSRPPSTPFILGIPNEILHHILSFLTDLPRDEFFVQYNSGGKNYKVAQMLVLRSVCRKFRAITAELDFWYDPEFFFADLISFDRYSVESYMRPYHEQRFLKILFSDTGLVNSLGRRKTDWNIESLGELMAVMEDIPWFTQNARAIHLEMSGNNAHLHPSPLDVAIQKLAACANITKLSVHMGRNVDLDAIVASFPFLEILICTETDDYSGSLQELSRLQRLHIEGWDNDFPEIMPILPLNSAETLTELTIMCGIVDNPIFSTDALDAFINLKSLDVGPWCESICDFIIGAKIHLEVFNVSLRRWSAPIEKFVNMLGAECLRNLKEFGLSNFRDSTSDMRATEIYWSLIFDAFTSTLLSVEEVQLSAPFHLRCCPYFSRMINLKILNWDGQTNPLFGFGRNVDPKEKMREALDKAFANFREKPQFAVHRL